MVEGTKLGDGAHVPRARPGADRPEVACPPTRSWPDPRRTSRERAQGRHGGFGGRRFPRHRARTASSRNRRIWASSRACDIGATTLRAALRADGLDVPVTVMNDADALAAGIAATERIARTADPRLVPGRRHRLRALSRTAKASGRPATWWSRSTPRSASAAAAAWGTWKASWAIAPCACASSIWSRKKSSPPHVTATPGRREFVNLWHRALAAGTATSIHLDGPGRFYIAGPNADFVDLNRLGMLLAGHGQDEPAAGDATSRRSPPAKTWR